MKLEYKHQGPTEVVYTDAWTPDAISYEEGTREKSTVFAPGETSFQFLLPHHRYLSKKSNSRAPIQFWMEILSYRLGCLFGVTVPPAFISIDSSGECRALIEWFYKDENFLTSYASGYSTIKGLDSDIDKEKGTRHRLNLTYATIDMIVRWRQASLNQVKGSILAWIVKKFADTDLEKLISDLSIRENFVRIFVFDALIANTYRHHENWGLVIDVSKLVLGEISPVFTLSPAFDNGTSLGYNFLEEKLPDYLKAPNWFKQYASRCTHHLRREAGSAQFKHDELIQVLLQNHPDCFVFSGKHRIF